MNRLPANPSHAPQRFEPTSLVLLLLITLLASCVEPRPVLEPAPQLPPQFSDNLVLQRNARNVLWGRAARGKQVWVRFKNLTGKTTSNRDGDWKIELDLTKLKDLGPDKLEIGVGKADQPAVVLTNVVVGEVWLLGVCNGKGVSIPPTNLLSFGQEKIRFLTATNLSSLRDTQTDAIAPWRVCALGSIDPRQISALSFYVATAVTNGYPGYIGIVQTSLSDLAEGLRPTKSAQEKVRAERHETLGIWLHDVWLKATTAVVDAQRAQRDRNREAILQGQEQDRSQLNQYDKFPIVYSREAFDSQKPPASLLNFDGAIW